MFVFNPQRAAKSRSFDRASSPPLASAVKSTSESVRGAGFARLSSCFCSSCVSSFSIMASPSPPPPSVPRTSSLFKGVYLGINLRPEWRQNAPSRPGSASIRQPAAPRQRGARGRVGIMCSGVKLRAELLFSTKTIISTFPTIILIPRPITAITSCDNPAINNLCRLCCFCCSFVL